MQLIFPLLDVAQGSEPLLIEPLNATTPQEGVSLKGLIDTRHPEGSKCTLHHNRCMQTTIASYSLTGLGYQLLSIVVWPEISTIQR